MGLFVHTHKYVKNIDLIECDHSLGMITYAKIEVDIDTSLFNIISKWEHLTLYTTDGVDWYDNHNRQHSKYIGLYLKDLIKIMLRQQEK